MGTRIKVDDKKGGAELRPLEFVEKCLGHILGGAYSSISKVTSVAHILYKVKDRQGIMVFISVWLQALVV